VYLRERRGGERKPGALFCLLRERNAFSRRGGEGKRGFGGGWGRASGLALGDSSISWGGDKAEHPFEWNLKEFAFSKRSPYSVEGKGSE